MPTEINARAFLDTLRADLEQVRGHNDAADAARLLRIHANCEEARGWDAERMAHDAHRRAGQDVPTILAESSRAVEAHYRQIAQTHFAAAHQLRSESMRLETGAAA